MIITIFFLPQVDDLLAMLEREGGDSPSPEDEIDGGLSIDEVESMKNVVCKIWMNMACTNLVVSSQNVYFIWPLVP